MSGGQLAGVGGGKRGNGGEFLRGQEKFLGKFKGQRALPKGFAGGAEKGKGRRKGGLGCHEKRGTSFVLWEVVWCARRAFTGDFLGGGRGAGGVWEGGLW